MLHGSKNTFQKPFSHCENIDLLTHNFVEIIYMENQYINILCLHSVELSPFPCYV